MSIKRTVDGLGNINYKNKRGEYHREDGPAYEEDNGYKEWCINDKVHREDGPAVIWSDGEEWYYLYDNRYNKEDWEIEVLKIKLKRIKNL